MIENPYNSPKYVDSRPQVRRWTVSQRLVVIFSLPATILAFLVGTIGATIAGYLTIDLETRFAMSDVLLWSVLLGIGIVAAGAMLVACAYVFQRLGQAAS